mgnify:CR=1 FL=1
MASTTPHAAAWRRHCLSLSALLGSCVPLAATAQADAEAEPQQVTIRAAKPAAGVTGFGQIPLASVPMQASVTTTEQMHDLGVRRLSDIAHIDAAVGDGYNAEGYYDFLTVRGFVLDNRFNYRRDGLPISAETTIPLDNKSRVEVLKGTSGMLAGLGSPGGMVDFAVKRPTEAPLREATLGWRQDGSVLAATDLSDRFGAGREFGLRVNAAYEHLDPQTYDAKGSRWLVALAGDWRVAARTLLEAEIEVSHREQPSVPGFSVLGTVVPNPGNPRINLNNQPWSQPGVFDATTASLRWRTELDGATRFTAHAMTQHLRSNDRVAFPFGCSAEDKFDRYCSDGSFDLYDFRSENERRTQDAAQLALKGKLRTGAVAHDLGLSLLWSRVENRFQKEAYNYVGSGNVLGTAMLPADPSLTTQNTNRDERSVELALHDAIRFNERLTAWFGLRHTSLARDSVRTNGSRPTHYDQSFTTPFAAISVKLSEAAMAYASAGQGIESQVVPNKASQYSNPGEALPALKSRQWEMGAKGRSGALAWQLAWFHVVRPMSNIDGCARLDISPCLGAYDGSARHQGLELQGQWTGGPWTLGAGLTAIDAKRQGSLLESATNGQRPTNVPNLVLRAQAAYRVAAAPGLQLRAGLSHEGRRNVLPDGSLFMAMEFLEGEDLADRIKRAGRNRKPALWAGGDERI